MHGLQLGDRVTFDSTIYCGQCFYCGRGEVNLCDNRQVMGVSPGPYRRHGAFAEYVAVPRRIVYKLPPELSYEQAAMIEAVSVAMHAVNLTPGASGRYRGSHRGGNDRRTGGASLRAAGCARVIAVDPNEQRLAMARELGATDTATTAESYNADLCLECVGTKDSVRAAISSVRKGGAVTLVGNVAPTVELPLQEVVTRQIRLQGSCASSGEYPAAIDLMARGIIRVDPLISAVAPLRKAPSGSASSIAARGI